MTIQADNIVIATGSRPIEIPGFKFDGKRIVDSTGALGVRRRARAVRRDRRRLHRHRDRHAVRQARLEGDGRRGAAQHPARQRSRDWSAWSRASSRSWASRCITGAKAQVVDEARTARAAVTRRRRRQGSDARRRQGAGRRSGGARTRRAWGWRRSGVKVERGFITVDKQHAHQRPRHLRHRRRRGPADAGAQGVAARRRWSPR